MSDSPIAAARTVLFVQHYPDGGSITGLLDLIRGLDPARFRPLVAFPTSNAFVPEFRAAGVPVVLLDGSSGAVPHSAAPVLPPQPPIDRPRSSALRRELRRLFKRDLRSARVLVRIIRSQYVDVVHANNDVLSNRDAIVAAVLTRRPVVVHVRWLHAYEDDAKLRIDRLLARRVAHFFFMSRAIAAGCSELRIPADHTSVLDDPFHAADYDVEEPAGLRDELGIPGGSRVVLHLGRIIPWKGQDVFLRAMADVIAREPDAVALLVGEPTDQRGREFREELRELVGELGIDQQVVFAGARRDVPQLIALSEIVVHCSTTPEPFGRVVVEGMAGGRPVVAADAGGVPEIVDPGVTGILVAPNDPGRLGAAIAELIADPAEAVAMGARARVAVTARFTIEAAADAVQAVYERC